MATIYPQKNSRLNVPHTQLNHYLIAQFAWILLVICIFQARPSVASSLEQAAQMDYQSVQQLKAFPFSNEPSAQTLQADTRFVQARQKLYLASENNLPQRMQLAGLDLGFRLRMRMENMNYPTQIQSLWSLSACQADLIMGRYFARYSHALSHDDELEMLLVLTEYQNALTCLAGAQVVAWVEMLGSQLIHMEREWEYLGWSEASLNSTERLALFNMVLLAVDISKYSGKSAAHLWLIRYADALEKQAIARGLSIYLYEPLSGKLLGQQFSAYQPLHLDKLLEPVNIGMGACSFVEMQANGLATNNFSCARELECTNAQPSKAKSSFFSRISKRGRAIGASPFEIPKANLQASNCSQGVGGQVGQAGMNGVGQGKSGGQGVGGVGSQIGNRAGSGWQACATATLISEQLGNRYGQCQIQAQMQKKGGLQPVQIPVTGVPIGSSGSCTNPYAQSNTNSAEKREKNLEGAKKIAEKFYETQQGKKFIEEVTRKTLERIRDDKGDPILGNIYKTGAENELANLDSAVDSTTKSAKAATTNAKDANLNPNPKADTIKQGDSARGDVRIDMGVHKNAKKAAGTLIHEAAGHAVIDSAARRAGKGEGLSDKEHHEIMSEVLEENPDIAKAIGKASDEKAKDIRKELKAQAEGKLQPSPDGGELCGAAREAMQQFMECQMGDNFGQPPQPGSPIRPDPGRMQVDKGNVMTTIDPEHPNSFKSNAVTSCMAQHGIGTLKIGKDGFVSASLGPNASSSGCAAMLCGPDGAARRSGSGQCVCSTSNGAVLRDIGGERLCQTSDVCFNKLMLNGADIRRDVPINQLPRNNINQPIQQIKIKPIQQKIHIEPTRQVDPVIKPKEL